MSQYFDFLKEYRNVYQNAVYTEEMLDSVDSLYTLGSFENQMRKTLEALVNKLVNVKLKDVDSSLELSKKINILYREGIIDSVSKENYHAIRKGGNDGSHAYETMDTYTQQRIYKEKKELAENAYKRLYVECHRFVFEYMADGASADSSTDYVESAYSSISSDTPQKPVHIESASPSRTVNSSNVSSVSFGRFDEADEADNDEDFTIPKIRSNIKLTILKILMYVCWGFYAIKRLSFDGKTDFHNLRRHSFDFIWCNYFDYLTYCNGYKSPEFYLINAGFILCIIIAVTTYKNNKNTPGYNGRNSKGVISIFIIPAIIITFSFFIFPYSVSISEGTTVLSGTYQHKGTPSPDYDNYDEWKKTYLKDVSVTCIDKGAISATYLVETDDVSFTLELPPDLYLDWDRDSKFRAKYNYFPGYDQAIECLDNGGILFKFYIISPVGELLYQEVEENRYTKCYYDYQSGLRVVATVDPYYGEEYLGTSIIGSNSLFISRYIDSVQFIH